MGVYSRSEDKPFKEAGFKPAQGDFAGARKYSDWKFVYVAPAAAQPATPTSSRSAARINR
ncbi:MAG: type II secretion system protein, partial [Burkholderiales bacterium]